MQYFKMQIRDGSDGKNYVDEVLKDNRITAHIDYAGEQFEKLQYGDVGLIHKGSNPHSLVKVLHKIQDKTKIKGTSFGIDYRVEILNYFKDLDKSFPFYDSSFKVGHNGTFSYLNEPKKTRKFLKKWYTYIRQNNIMDNCKLSDNRIQEITTLWKNYRKRIDKNEIDKVRKEIDVLKNGWEIYRRKLIDDSLELQDYTNRKENNHNVPGKYLCNFLERTTKTVFGSSKPPGSAHGFEVKLNDDNSSYFVLNVDPNCSLDEANDYYENNIKPLICEIAKEEDPLLKISLIEDSEYRAKQILRKLAVLNHLDDFLFIYNDTIDILYDEFLMPNENSNLGKNYELRQLLNEIFDIDKTDEVEL